MQAHGTHVLGELATLDGFHGHRPTKAGAFAKKEHEHKGRQLQERRTQAAAAHGLDGVGRDEAGQIAQPSHDLM